MPMSRVRLFIFNLIVTISIFLIGCSSISVSNDYDPQYDFSKLKTFGFIPVPADAGIDQLSAKKLDTAIKSQLLPKGYTVADKPDFAIALMFSSKTKTSVQSYGYGYGYGGYWGGPGMYGAGGVDVYQYDEGTLVIDVVDMSDQKLIWRGVATGTMSESPSMEERTEKINTAVAKLFANFPPEKSQK